MEVLCLVCGSASVPYTTKNQCSMHRCPKCQLIFVSPMPDNTLEVYEGDYFTGATQGFGYTDYDADKLPMVPAFKTYLRRIAHYNPPAPGKRMLDVGAATGFFLNLARDAGWTTAVGVEPSASAAETARKKQLDVKTGILEPGLYEPASFDVITLWDVIEHVPDPKAMMNLVR